jgi:endonuclease/exonuclease/phosphatase family metal-dependent hydrolase
MRNLLLILISLYAGLYAQDSETIEIGTFNIEWFPCKDDGAMMAEYGINLRYPPKGSATDQDSLFHFLKDSDIELLAVQEIVDPELLKQKAKQYLGPQFDVIYSNSGGSQKVGFLYDSSVLELIGEPESYDELLLTPDSRLRPAFRAYFKSKPHGFDFHALVVHLKSSPRGWDQRKQQLEILEAILKQIPKINNDSDIVLLGDMNNVTEADSGEFLPMMKRLGFYWATQELSGKPTNYWQPDWQVNRIQGSAIDHIFVSADARVEYISNKTGVFGPCAAAIPAYENNDIPDFYNKISDHCPVFATFRVDIDND